MANYKSYGYQYETSPRKLQPEYEPKKNQYKKKKRIKTPPHSISTFIFTQSKHIKTFET